NRLCVSSSLCFFFIVPATTEIYTLSLHDALPILGAAGQVHLSDVPGNDGSGAKANPGQEHFHLFTGSVLAFIQDDKGIVQGSSRSEEHTSELQSRENLVCRLLLEKKHHGRRMSTS